MEEIEKSGVTKQNNRSTFSKRWWIPLVLVALLGTAAYVFWLHPGKVGPGSSRSEHETPSPAIPVVAVEAKKADFNIYATGLGSVTPVQTVIVKTQVDGQLMEVHFDEGQIVNQGDLLASIDPRPFEVQLLQAEGQMAHDLALLKNAQVDLARYRVLWEQDSIAKQQVDTQEALIRELEGTIKVDQGQIESARLQLTYCRITAPLRGRVGLRLVDPGNIVHTSDANGMAVITQLQPMTVIFSLPEDSLRRVLAGLKTSEPMPVEAYDRDMKRKIAVGSLMSIDNQIDPATGTFRLRARFPNEGNELFPNQFVNARLLVEVRRGATVVAAAAIQRGPQGPFVYVVEPDLRVRVRPVIIEEIQEGEAAIKSGLSPGELAVVEGGQRLREGSRVELKAPAQNGNTLPRNHE
jgi:membrane fusion protein, multidrug efflux system